MITLRVDDQTQQKKMIQTLHIETKEIIINQKKKIVTIEAL